MFVQMLEGVDDLARRVTTVFGELHHVRRVDAVVRRQEVIEVGAPLVLALQVGEVPCDQIDEL